MTSIAPAPTPTPESTSTSASTSASASSATPTASSAPASSLASLSASSSSTAIGVAKTTESTFDVESKWEKEMVMAEVKTPHLCRYLEACGLTDPETRRAALFMIGRLLCREKDSWQCEPWFVGPSSGRIRYLIQMMEGIGCEIVPDHQAPFYAEPAPVLEVDGTESSHYRHNGAGFAPLSIRLQCPPRPYGGCPVVYEHRLVTSGDPSSTEEKKEGGTAASPTGEASGGRKGTKRKSAPSDPWTGFEWSCRVSGERMVLDKSKSCRIEGSYMGVRGFLCVDSSSDLPSTMLSRGPAHSIGRRRVVFWLSEWTFPKEWADKAESKLERSEGMDKGEATPFYWEPLVTSELEVLSRQVDQLVLALKHESIWAFLPRRFSLG